MYNELTQIGWGTRLADKSPLNWLDDLPITESEASSRLVGPCPQWTVEPMDYCIILIGRNEIIEIQVKLKNENKAYRAILPLINKK